MVHLAAFRMYHLLRRSWCLRSSFNWKKYAVSAQPGKAFDVLETNGETNTATFQTKDFKLFKLESGPTTIVNLSKSEGKLLYRQMKAIRAMENGVIEMTKTHPMPGPTHLYTGQEACAVGIMAAIRPDDAVITAYRLHGYAYLKGISIHRILAELLGRQTGGSKGKGGSMHLYNKSTHFYGGFGIVGSEVPVGVGIALARRKSTPDALCVTLYGDGAASQGQVYEAFNMAKLWNLPVLFVCENNQKSRQEETPRVLGHGDLYTRGQYIPGIWVDGMDVLAVRTATSWAADYIRSGKGPLVMELDTSYFDGHYHGHLTMPNCKADAKLSPKEQEKDPLLLLRHQLITAELLSEDKLQEIEDEIDQIVAESITMATQDPVTDLTEMYTDIYTNTPDIRVRGSDVFTKYVTKT